MMTTPRWGLALLICSVGAACEPVGPPDHATDSSAAQGGGYTPGPTPPRGPTCNGPTSLSNSLYSWSSNSTPVDARSTTWAPAISAYAEYQVAGAFRSGGRALDARTTGDGAAALSATAQGSGGIAIEARAFSANALPLRIESTGGGNLLDARRYYDTNPRFLIRHDGYPWSKGTTISEFGPTGDQGPKGSTGSTGPKGSSGPRGWGETVAICSAESSCLTVCSGTWMAANVPAPCFVGSDHGYCERNGSSGSCCVCGM